MDTMPTTTDLDDLVTHAHTLSLEINRYRGRDPRAMHTMSVELDATWERIAALRELREIAR